MKNSELINQIKMGNHSNVYRLYNYFPTIKKWLVKNGCERNDAKDIYQEALLLFCLKCRKEEFNLTSTIETYLFSVSKFIFYNKRRKDAKMPITDDLQNLASVESDYAAYTEKEQKLAHAFKALEAISEKCNQVLQLFYIKRLNMSEIAERLGYRSEAVAKNQKYKCLNLAKNKTIEFAKSNKH